MKFTNIETKRIVVKFFNKKVVLTCCTIYYGYSISGGGIGVRGYRVIRVAG